MKVPKITTAFLADCERLAKKTIDENAYQDAREMKVGSSILLVAPENQLAMVMRIRELETFLATAIGELRDTGGPFASDVADRIEQAAGIAELSAT